MKKIIAVLLILVLSFSFCACGEEVVELTIGDLFEKESAFPKSWEGAWMNENGKAGCYISFEDLVFDSSFVHEPNVINFGHALYFPFFITIKAQDGNYVRTLNDEITFVMNGDKLESIVIQDKTLEYSIFNGTYKPQGQ